MPLIEIIPALAVLAFIGFLILCAAPGEKTGSATWVFPATMSLLFLGFSAVTIGTEGPFGFWMEHTRNLWGNQVWVDLLLAIAIAWSLLVPEARNLGMRPVPWMVAICLSGCIGLLAMYARVLYLRYRRRAVQASLVTAA